MKFRLVWLFTVIAGSCWVAVDAAPRPFEVRDLVTLDRVSDPRMSPGGKTVAFQLRSTDLDANKGTTSIWTVPIDGSASARRLTPIGMTASLPRWSPDGRLLYFTSNKSGSNQVWRHDFASGQVRQVTDLALDVGSFRIAPDGRALALSMEVFPDCADLACSRKRIDEKAKPKATGVVYDKLFVRHWDTWKTGSRSQLFVSTLGDDGTAAEPVLVSRNTDGDVPSKPFGDDGDYTYSPDGKFIVFAARIAGTTEPWSTNFDLFLASVDGSTVPANLTAGNRAVDTGPVFSPDGGTLFYRAMKRPGFEADRLAIMAMDMKTRTSREVAPDWDRSADNLKVSDDGDTLYASVGDLGRTSLYSIDVSSGKTQLLARGGTISEFSLGAGHVVFAYDDLDSPADLYAQRLPRGKPKPLTQVNAKRLADVRFAQYEQFEFAGWNGETVRGFVMKPWNYVSGEKYPVAFVIHGGPQGSMGDHFHYRWNPQTYAGQGFAVVFIDFHGSTGYGQAFTDSISGDWGGKPLEDLQKGWEAALAKFDFLDGKRACALGASYGGYMVNWIAGNWPEPWRCLVNHDGVFDNRMMGYSTEELWFDEWEMGGTPFDKPENYEKHNPVAHVAKWKVPMLVIHGQLDFRIPVEQGLGAFTALQRRGVPSQFLYFPDENHWVLKPQNSIQWHNIVNAWLKRWTETPLAVK